MPKITRALFTIILLLGIEAWAVSLPTMVVAQITVYENFEDQSYSDDANCYSSGSDGVYWGQQECAADSVSISSTKAREGTYSSKHYIWSGCLVGLTPPKQRAEISGATCTAYEPVLSSSLYHGISIYVGDDLQALHDVGQVLQYAVSYESCSVTPGTTMSAVFALSIKDGVWTVTSRACQDDGTGVDNVFLPFTSGSDAIADKGKWVDIVFYIYFRNRTQADGIIQVWKNGTLVVDYGPVKTSYDRPSGEVGYRKLGIYNSDADGATPMTIYEDAFRRKAVSAGGSYAAVCPRVPPTAPTNVAPSGGATGVAINPTLTASAYGAGYAAAAFSLINDARGDFLHLATQFQVDVGSGPTWANPIYNRTVCHPSITKPSWCDEQDAEVGVGSTVSTSTWAINLTASTLYSVRMRHANMAYISGTAGVDRDYDASTPPTDTDDVYWGPWSTVTTFTTGTGQGDPPSGSSNWSGSITGSF